MSDAGGADGGAADAGGADGGQGAAAPPSRLARWAPAQDIRAGLIAVAVLAVLGALLGVVWQLWSPAGPAGLVLSPGAVEADENEAFIASDGRFAVIVVGVGLLAGTIAWSLRRTRGPAVVAGLAVGGVIGALLTNLVGHLIRGGTGDGRANTFIRHLPLSVHASGLLFLEAAAAVLVYLVCTSFAAADDLGRPETGAADARSVRVGGQVQDSRSDADAAGGLQQGYLPPQ